MSKIENYLKQILSAVYGKDVRQSIHDAIAQCYDDVSNPKLSTEALKESIQSRIQELLDDGSLANMTIADESITTEKYQNASVTKEKLGDDVIFGIMEVSGASSMTDTSMLYRYVGTETGYSSGSLYYYNGSKWARVGTGSSNSNKLPVLYLTGDTSEMNKEVRSNLQYTYVDSMNNEQRTGWCDAKWQGDSSIGYPKKNYTFRFYHDSSYGRKDKTGFFGMAEESKWVAKANYIDHSHARNIVSARLWADIVKSRKNDVPDLLANSSNYGAINGYPIIIYLNGEYLGLYTLNIPKDDWTFGMDEENPLHCCAYGQYNNNGGTQSGGGVESNEFRLASTLGWECEVPGAFTTETSKALTDLISFVINATDEEFKSGLDTYLDVESAIDYYIFCYFICASDSLAQNMILLTYDCAKWYCSAYDLDSTFGLYWNGTTFYDYDTPCPEGYQDTNSLLWERMEVCFGAEIYSRYMELRSSVLSLDYVNREFEMFIGGIDADDYKADIEKWTSIPQKHTDHLNQIKTFIANRSEYVDNQMKRLSGFIIPAESVTLNKTSLEFTSRTPQTLSATITPSTYTEEVTWTSSDNSVATVANGVVTPITNGSCKITVQVGNHSATCDVTITGLLSPYALKNGSKIFSDGTVITISNGNHVKVVSGSTAINSGQVCLSDINLNSDTITDPNWQSTDVYFTASKSIATSKENTTISNTATNEMTIYYKPVNSLYTRNLIENHTVSNNASNTIVPNMQNIGAIGMWFGIPANTTLEFDLSLVVDDTKYI